MSKRYNRCLVATLIFLTSLDSAHAYLDPGAGSFIFQILAGAFATLVIVLSSGKEQIKSWFKRLSQKKNKIDEKER